jgi:hypothetical protein
MTCSIKSCPRDAFARGLCQTHYKRWRRIQTLSPKEIARRMLEPIHDHETGPIPALKGVSK